MRYLFEDYALDTDRRELRHGGTLVAIEPQVFDLLAYLVQHRERVVTKDDLLEAVWNGRNVSESALTTRINAARVALGDTGEAQRLIRTLRGRGIRFVGDAREASDGSPVLAPPVTTDATANSFPSAGDVSNPVAVKVGAEVPAGERKHVTVLCADFKEPLGCIAQRDPEEALNIFESILPLITQAVQQYDGTIYLATPDRILALFGAPFAHEDSAVRACYAALRLQEMVKQYCEGSHHLAEVPSLVRAGLSSGEVVIRPVARGPHPEFRVVGEATHFAARLGQIAAPGTSLVSAETLRLAEGHVQVRILEETSPLSETLYELVGLGPWKTRFLARASQGLARFVGRNAELQQFRRIQQLAGVGHGQIVAVVGEAGVGKSRFVYEVSHSHALDGWLTLECASVSYGRTTSYLPVIDLLKAYFHIRDRDDPRGIREKVTDKLLALDERLKTVFPALLALLDVPVEDTSWQTLDPGQRRQLTLDAVRRLLLREARKQPLLLIFEDLHWIDGETQALLDSLVESLGSAHLVLLVNYRPEYQHNWGGKTYYTQLRFDALPVNDTGELLDALLGDDIGLAPLKQLLVKRGNPFFLEETVRTLAEMKTLQGQRGRYRLTQPIQVVQVPPSVQTMLAARIDCLSTQDKGLLQTASVVGKDVPFALLQAVAGLADEELRRALNSLQTAEFIYEVGLFPDVEYTFKHALTHEVTYSGLLRERRRELHARTVDAIETLHADRISEHIERLAHHALRGEVWEKALPYLRQAGLKAAARSALLDARVWFEQALGVLEALPESPSTLELGFEIRLELRPVLNQLGEVRQALERMREAKAIAERLTDDRGEGRVCALMTNSHSLLGELDEARASGTRALEIARVLGDLELRILTSTYLEQVEYLRGEYERVVELATGNLAALPAHRVQEYFGLPSPASVYNRVWLTMSLAQLGRFAEAAEHEAEAIRLAEPTHHAHSVGLAYYSAGVLYLLEGGWTQSRPLLERGITAFRTGNVVLQLPNAVALYAWVLAQLGESSEAVNQLREGEQLLERFAAPGGVGRRGWTYHALGRTCLLLGLLDEARTLGSRVIESLPSQFGYAAHAHHLLGDIATHSDRFDPERGEVHYRQALALAEPRGMRPLVAHCHLGLGKLYRHAGTQARAKQHLATASIMYREMEMSFWFEQAETAMP